jgi:hypothetical protein
MTPPFSCPKNAACRLRFRTSFQLPAKLPASCQTAQRNFAIKKPEGLRTGERLNCGKEMADRKGQSKIRNAPRNIRDLLSGNGTRIPLLI